jgi:hypothetical protein
MTKNMDESHGNIVPPEETVIEDDDKMVEAEKPAKRNDFIEADMTELLLRYRIPFRKGQSGSKNHQHHIKFLRLITTAFDKATVRIYENKNNRAKAILELKWMDQEYSMEYFNLHVDEQQRKTVIVHCVMSTKSILDIKNEPTIIQHLKSSDTFLRGHFWKEDQVSLKDIGFLMPYVPTKHSRAFVINNIFK